MQQENGGKACAGSTWEAQVCNTQACAVEGKCSAIGRIRQVYMAHYNENI